MTPDAGPPSGVRILFEDNHLLALAKPAGLLTQPSGTPCESLEERAKEYIRTSKGKRGNVFLHAVHRLDRVVSGVVLFARTGKALSRLSEAQRERRFRKVYLALTDRRPPRPEGRLVHHLLHGNGRAEVSRAGEEGTRESVLSYQVIREKEGLFLLEIELHTGRYHQIRAQLAAEGMPILGDRKYGGTVPFAGGAIALHHALLEFDHPVGGAPVRIESPLPSAWPVV
ncbi:MAG: RluA family pseudouridine synthase [Candidatus Eisenbacteria bacterium]|nr:RluA family pseudouridine synthase [Candidatus Eisenbacteria bacterium]